MFIDHVNVKIFAQTPVTIDLGDAIPVFHHWIQEPSSEELAHNKLASSGQVHRVPPLFGAASSGLCALEELLIDVADYRHVPAGPGVLLIGHEANYSLDCTFDKLGILYNRKRGFEGSVQDKLLKSFGAALTAASRLENEPPFRGKLKFDAGQVEVIVNDRLLAPNTEETWSALQPEFSKFFDGLYGPDFYTLERVGEPRERFRVQAQTPTIVEVSSLFGAFAAV